jgi:SET and MYND domain-containing protein 4
MFRSLLQSLSLANIAYDKYAKLKKFTESMLDYLQKQLDILGLSEKPKNPKEEKEKEIISSAIEYKYTEEQGRFAVAKSKIMVTDPIIRERPHCSVLLEQFAHTHCELCLKRYVKVNEI